MPWRLLLTLILCAVLIVFIGLNLDNRASVSFGFYVFNDVPVFVSMFVSFICGALIMMPFTIGRKKKKNKKTDINENDKKNRKDDVPPVLSAPDKSAEKEKKKSILNLFGRKKESAVTKDE